MITGNKMSGNMWLISHASSRIVEIIMASSKTTRRTLLWLLLLPVSRTHIYDNENTMIYGQEIKHKRGKDC